MKKQQRVSIVGVPISAVNMDDCLKFVSNHFDAIRGEYICASNVHTTVMAHDNPVYWDVQNEAVLAIPDGKPLSVLGRRRGFPDMSKVTGIHFMVKAFTDKRFRDKRHFFYGTTPETLEKMICKVKKDYPELAICGWEPSVFRELSNAEVEELAQRINVTQADFIWIAIGAPRQELLMHCLRGKVDGVMTGVGGAFNILAGIIPNAPQWMQNAGLEWFYRLMKEPRRLFKRYLFTNSKFIWYLLTEKRE